MAQCLYEVDPFRAAALPFDQLDPNALSTGLLAERGSPFFPLHRYNQQLGYHNSMVVSADGLQMAAETARRSR